MKKRTKSSTMTKYGTFKRDIQTQLKKTKTTMPRNQTELKSKCAISTHAHKEKKNVLDILCGY